MTSETPAPGPQPSTATPDRASGTAPNLATREPVSAISANLSAKPEPRAPEPRKVPLPLGGSASMYTRENLTLLFKCAHGELGRLLARRMAPLPVRIDGQILWYVDEIIPATAQVQRTIERWRKR